MEKIYRGENYKHVPAEGLDPGWMVPPRTKERLPAASGSSLPNEAANSSYSFAASASARCKSTTK